MWSLEKELALMMRRSYKREELLALQETGKKAVTEQQQEPWVENILAALEFFADDFYEMEKNNNGQVKSRHRNADRRQRGARGVPKSWDRGLDQQACEVGQEQGVTAAAAGWSHNNNKGGGAAAVVERAEVDEDEEEEEEEDSEEDIDSFQPRAFAVEGEPDFASGPPQDGWEYLRRVRQVWEAAQCPKVKVAKIDPQKLMVEQTPYMPSIPSVQPCASHLLPSKEWETEFLVDFSNLRTASTNGSGSTTTIGGVLKLVDEELGSKMEISGYEGTVELQAEISGYPKDTIQTSQDVVDGLKIGGMLGASKDPKPPLLGILVRLDAVSRAALLRFHIAWLERVDGLPYERTLWLFALSVVIDKPLDAQTSAAFRALLRRCAILRATKVSADDEELHRLNLLITIAGHYFGQSEDLLG
ncbi:unnamed protein product [Sphagnum jensenii]|uniref:Gem-associated protein 2 n=1 Tax=Sphagnum jensenii TaxID=128206 RepID=A0ABP0X1N4_9BRYO